jgi:hypothetical protein
MTTKPDYPALLPPGIHKLTMQDVFDLAVKPFTTDPQRSVLFENLRLWEAEVKNSGLSGVMWIDGSFLTQKLGPGDIDCVMWNPHWIDAASDTPANRQALQRLFDHSTAKTLYGLDFYLETPPVDNLVHREAYWKGFLGYCHDRVTAKGFAEIQL